MDPSVKAQATALLESGEMRVAEIAQLLGISRQLVTTWCPSALEARRQWCAKRWEQALNRAGRAAARSEKNNAKHRATWEAAWRKDNPGKPISVYRNMNRKDVLAWRTDYVPRAVAADLADYLADNPDKTADDYEIAQSCAIKTDDDPRHVEFQNWRELRERAKRNGYRVQKRGDQYKLIPEDGAPVGGDIDTVNAWLDMLETAKTSGQNIEYRTACGMPILTSNFDE